MGKKRSKLMSFWNVASTKTSVQLLINDPQAFYVTGDSIDGDLLLEVSEPAVTVSKMLVSIDGIAVRTLARVGRKTKKLIGNNKFTLELFHESGQTVSRGIHKIPFTYTIPDHICQNPPSVSFEAMGDKVSGVTWYLKATVELVDSAEPGKPHKPLTGTQTIIFYPTIPDRELVDSEKQLSAGGESDNMRFIIKLSTKLPQAPNFWDVEITILPRKPMVIHSVEIDLVQTVVFWCGGESRVMNRRERVGKLEYGKVVDKELVLDGVSQKWRLYKLATPAFTMTGANVNYSLKVSVQGTKRVTFEATEITFRSPAYERLKEKCTCQTQENYPTLPAYSEK